MHARIDSVAIVMEQKIRSILCEDAMLFEKSLASPLVACIEEATRMILASLKNGCKLLIAGNGGSAADAQHFAGELVGKFLKIREALPAMALSTDTSILTSIANDISYDEVFARQIEALGRSGDIFFGISTSGNSKNILRAIEVCRKKNVRVIGLTGEGGGVMASLADVLLAVPSRSTPRIQEVHTSVIHIISELIEEGMVNAISLAKSFESPIVHPMKKVLVAGGSGLIGGHLVKKLLESGVAVRAVGKRPFAEWKQLHGGAENLSLDLMRKENCEQVMEGIDEVYNLAAEIGGVNFIEKQKAQTMLSVLINTHLLLAASDRKVQRYFYASTNAVSAAEVPQEGRALTDVIEDGHVWEKLFSEKLCKYFREDFGLPTRIGRLQNIYGTYDAYDGGRERAPAALCRKAILAKASGNYDLEIWGDGTQLRAFMYVGDAVEAIMKLAASDIVDPVKLGSREFVTINQLVDAVEAAAGITFNRKYKLDAPRGIERKLGPETTADIAFNSAWSAQVSLRDGIKALYDWIEHDMRRKGLIANGK